MKKIILIGFKDVLLVFRDPAALVMMLLAPFLLTVGMGFVTGRFSGSTSSGLSEIPVVIVNLDGGELGNSLVSVFQSAELDELLVPTVLSDTLSARQLVDEDKAAAAVIMPAGFTRSIIPAAGQDPGSEVMKINLYLNPGRPTSAAVVQSIVDEFLSRVELGRVGAGR